MIFQELPPRGDDRRGIDGGWWEEHAVPVRGRAVGGKAPGPDDFLVQVTAPLSEVKDNEVIGVGSVGRD